MKLLILFILTTLYSSPCLDRCKTIEKTFCASNNQTLHLPENSDCYFKCNITSLYPYSCGCPNNCNFDSLKGLCYQDRCYCFQGFQGKDCSLIKCPNKCSGHGKCISDRCICDDGYTGYECISISSLSLKNPLPFGIIFNESNYYSSNEKYGDNHPLFDRSLISNLYLTVNISDLLYILHPSRIWNNEEIKGSITFDNGKLLIENYKVNFRVKGRSSRSRFEKNWVVKFEKKLFGIKGISLKSLTFQSYQISFEMFRSMNVLSQRSNFGNLFINGIHMGFFWIGEEINKSFFENRFENVGNYYKVMLGGLNLIGNSTEKDYREANRGFAYGRIRYLYSQKGNGSFSDLAQLINTINTSRDQEFKKNIPNILDVEKTLRYLMIDYLIRNNDGYSTTLNNYFLHSKKLFHFIPYDTEYSWMNIPEINWINTSIFNWGRFPRLNRKPALTSRLILLFKDRWIQLFKIALNSFWKKNDKLEKRIIDYSQLILPQLERDYTWKKGYQDRNIKTEYIKYLKMIEYINLKYDKIMNELK